MKALAVILNIFIPGVGSFVVGKAGQGIAQILIFGIGFVINLITLGFGAIIGFPLMLGAWIWGLITVLSTPSAPIQVNIIDNRGPDRH
jgi:TM2 domain-containing membrane protein YozV